jgi:hypothetical protein
MNIPPSVNGRSTDVRLHLVVGNRTLQLGQIGPGSVILEDPAELPPCEAEVVMYVDSFERRWQVYLPDGISAKSNRVRTVTREATPAGQNSR